MDNYLCKYCYTDRKLARAGNVCKGSKKLCSPQPPKGRAVKFCEIEIASGRLRYTHRYDPRNDGTSASHPSLRT
jgi:hypothetical protein